MKHGIFSRSFSRPWLAVISGVAALAGGFLYPPASRAAPEPCESASASAVNAWSPEGKRLLAVMVSIAGALVAMERVCSWRLERRLRRARADREALAAILPPILSKPLASHLRPARQYPVRWATRVRLTGLS